MISLNQFDRIDHLMIEVPDPESAYDALSETFGLPQAWPLLKSDRYQSIGVNFGNANVELIAFRERFGVRNTNHRGLGGVCLVTPVEYEQLGDELGRDQVAVLDGEDAVGHRTAVLDSKDAPTIFVCYFKFDTAGWKARLAQEFEQSQGGVHEVTKIEAVCINNPLLKKSEFDFRDAESARLIYSDTPEVKLKSSRSGSAGKSLVVGETLFSFC